jgi:hypothetical protein
LPQRINCTVIATTIDTTTQAVIAIFGLFHHFVSTAEASTSHEEGIDARETLKNHAVGSTAHLTTGITLLPINPNPISTIPLEAPTWCNRRVTIVARLNFAVSRTAVSLDGVHVVTCLVGQVENTITAHRTEKGGDGL